ncbi:porin family protein [Novosphingobium olei]|uniref:outer membrane protein n=1 Tax=Novosphingobium olei TaxID=2728851 RepID=UPI003088E9D0|nr:porin family protein [Novosphingobium olei]
MKKIVAALVAVSTIALAAPAFAQDASDETVSPSKNFSGLSVNTTIGWDHLRSGSTKDIDNTANVKQSLDGIVFGGGIGFDVPLGDRLTLGAEGEATTSSARWDNNNGVPNTFNLGRVKAERDLYVGARLGFAMSPKTLLYVKGGYTNARFALEGNGGGLVSNQRLDTDGWRAGAGIEQKLGDHGFGRIEYRYSNYQKAEFDFNGNTPDSSRFNIDTDRHQVVASVGVRF